MLRETSAANINNKSTSSPARAAAGRIATATKITGEKDFGYTHRLTSPSVAGKDGENSTGRV